MLVPLLVFAVRDMRVVRRRPSAVELSIQVDELGDHELHSLGRHHLVFDVGEQQRHRDRVAGRLLLHQLRVLFVADRVLFVACLLYTSDAADEL